MMTTESQSPQRYGAGRPQAQPQARPQEREQSRAQDGAQVRGQERPRSCPRVRAHSCPQDRGQERPASTPDVKELEWSLFCAEDMVKILRTKLQQKEDTIFDLSEKLDAQTKLGRDSDRADSLEQDRVQTEKKSESSTDALISEREQLEKKVQSLSHELDAQAKLGCDSVRAWQAKFDALKQESFMKEKKSESSTQALISEREVLEKKIQSMSHELETLTKFVCDINRAWQVKYDTLEMERHQPVKNKQFWHMKYDAQQYDIFMKDRKSKSTIEALHTECEDLKKKIQSLSEELETQTKERVPTEKNSESSTEALLTDREDLKKKIRSLSEKLETQTKESVLKEKNSESIRNALLDLLLKEREFQGIEKTGYEAEVQKLRGQILILEDVCIRQKKKNLGFFGRNMGDRETELERMKRKVPAREPVHLPPHEPPTSISTASAILMRPGSRHLVP